MMDNKILKGISLILFGILLCVCSGEVNGTILSDFSYFPFGVFGAVAGVVGIVMVFHKNKDKKDKQVLVSKDNKLKNILYMNVECLDE